MITAWAVTRVRKIPKYRWIEPTRLKLPAPFKLGQDIGIFMWFGYPSKYNLAKLGWVILNLKHNDDMIEIIIL